MLTRSDLSVFPTERKPLTSILHCLWAHSCTVSVQKGAGSEGFTSTDPFFPGREKDLGGKGL